MKPRMAATQAMFQSTLPRGERHSLPHVLNLTLKFQSTLPRGERRRTGRRRKSWTCFNPRSRGERHSLPHVLNLTLKFQSTLPRGERLLFNSREAAGRLVSIHAPAGGATTETPWPVGSKKFQSTLPRGERPRRLRLSRDQSGFNPRSRGGSDQ